MDVTAACVKLFLFMGILIKNKVSVHNRFNHLACATQCPPYLFVGG